AGIPLWPLRGGRREVERWGIARTTAADGHEVALREALGAGRAAARARSPRPTPETEALRTISALGCCKISRVCAVLSAAKRARNRPARRPVGTVLRSSAYQARRAPGPVDGRPRRQARAPAGRCTGSMPSDADRRARSLRVSARIAPRGPAPGINSRSECNGTYRTTSRVRAVAVDTRSRMILELSTALVFLAGICCYAGVSHLHIGLSRPRDLTHTSFGILCLLIATSALITSMAQSAAWPSESPLFAALRGLVVVLFGMVFPWFTAVYTGVRSRALPAAIALVYGLSWLANFVAPALLLSEPNLGPAMGTPYTLGDPRLAGVGLHWAGHVLLFVHLYYACWEQYRRGERRRALALAGSAVPLLATTVANALVMVGLIDF